MSPKEDQYARQAADWTEHAYADVAAYLAHRAELIVGLGPLLDPGDEVLDLACGDGGLGEALLARGLRYRGVDLTQEMVEAARTRLAGRAEVDVGDLNDYEPPSPVAATTVFRAVFDLNPRQYQVDDVVQDLQAGGFSSIELRPFFVPQTVSLPRLVLAAAKALERSGPFARVALRWRFTYLVAASR